LFVFSFKLIVVSFCISFCFFSLSLFLVGVSPHSKQEQVLLLLLLIIINSYYNYLYYNLNNFLLLFFSFSSLSLVYKQEIITRRFCVCVCVLFNLISIILIERFQFSAAISFIIHVMNFCALSCLYFFSFTFFCFSFVKTQNYLSFFVHSHTSSILLSSLLPVLISFHFSLYLLT